MTLKYAQDQADKRSSGNCGLTPHFLVATMHFLPPNVASNPKWPSPITHSQRRLVPDWPNHLAECQRLAFKLEFDLCAGQRWALHWEAPRPPKSSIKLAPPAAWIDHSQEINEGEEGESVLFVGRKLNSSCTQRIYDESARSWARITSVQPVQLRSPQHVAQL